MFFLLAGHSTVCSVNHSWLYINNYSSQSASCHSLHDSVLGFLFLQHTSHWAFSLSLIMSLWHIINRNTVIVHCCVCCQVIHQNLLSQSQQVNSRLLMLLKWFVSYSCLFLVSILNNLLFVSDNKLTYEPALLSTVVDILCKCLFICLLTMLGLLHYSTGSFYIG